MNQDKSPKDVEKAYEDCYYFLYSNCKRGDTCIYRHCLEAKASTKLCPEWDNTKKCELNCPLRHSYYHLQKKRSSDMCYFEETPQGCTKQFCEYRHKDPSRDAWKINDGENINSGMTESLKIIEEPNKPNDYSNTFISTVYKDNYEEFTNNDSNSPKNINYQIKQKNKENPQSNSISLPNTKKLTENKKIQSRNTVSNLQLNQNEDDFFYERLKSENTSLITAIEEVEKEIEEANNFLLRFTK